MRWVLPGCCAGVPPGRGWAGSIDRMQVLITGGAGFIGSHLGDALLAGGHTVRALDNLDPQVHPGGARPGYLDPAIELHVGDVRDHDAVSKALEGIDHVVHFAAAVGVGQSMYEIERYTSINSIGAAVVLEEIAKRRDHLARVLVASSMSIYGEGRYRCPEHGLLAPQVRSDEQLDARDWELRCPTCQKPLDPLPTGEDKPIQPMSIYAVNKRDHEEMFLSIGRAHRLPTVAMRFFNVYGDRQALSNPYTGVAAIFGGRLLNDHRPLVFEDGLQSRDFIHVSDIAAGCVAALETGGADDRAVNLGTGVSSSVLDVARELARGLGKEQLEPEVVNKYRAGDIRHCFSDISLARETLGFAPKVTFADGMRELLGWVATQQATDSVDAAAGQLEAAGLTR
jgi:dTDP-L-rhamnose 4-epimerase